MARNVTRHLRDERQKEFIRIFDQACRRHNRWTVWADFVVMAAISISNTVDKSNAESREKTYMTLASKYDKSELECICRMFAEVVNGIDVNPDQDFLGELFMTLELGNDHNGQFFTPYNVCKMMAKMTYGKDLEERIERRGWVSVNDPACGAGALLVAFANECKLQHTNYQTSVLFVAQDIDYIVGCMCYIQLSLLGCPGYVVIADSLLNPCTGVDGNPLVPVPGENIWYTPMYFRDVWHYRRLWWQVDRVTRSTPRPTEPPDGPEPVPVQEAPAETAQEPEAPALNETQAGQLTFF